MSKSHETDIKAALIDWLVSKEHLSEIVLANEMVVANWTRRLDIALISDKLHAYEIKSDFDSLNRLNGQLSAYTPRFDKTTVVCSQKFTHSVLSQTHDSVGVLEVANRNGQITFKTIRRGKTTIVTDKRILLSYLNKSDLLLLTRKKFKTNNGLTKNELENQALKLSITEVRHFVLNVLKQRYQDTSNAFLQQKSKHTTSHELERLSRFKKNKHLPSQYAIRSNIELSQQHIIEINHDRIKQKYGHIPEDFPKFVRRRITS